MDLDTTLRGLPLTEEKVLEAVGNIIRIDLEDEVTFETVSINTIRKDDNYGVIIYKSCGSIITKTTRYSENHKSTIEFE